jgi:hypothetical protein
VKIQDFEARERMAKGNGNRPSPNEIAQAQREHAAGVSLLIYIVVIAGLSAAVWTSGFPTSTKIALQTVLAALTVYWTGMLTRP